MRVAHDVNDLRVSTIALPHQSSIEPSLSTLNWSGTSAPLHGESHHFKEDRDSLKLTDFERMRGLVSIRALARSVGMAELTLHSRLQRGGPELTKEESALIIEALALAGLKPLAQTKSRVSKIRS